MMQTENALEVLLPPEDVLKVDLAVAVQHGSFEGRDAPSSVDGACRHMTPTNTSAAGAKSTPNNAK